jgi:hypothetical protein
VAAFDLFPPHSRITCSIVSRSNACRPVADDPDVGLLQPRPAEPLTLPLLEHAQEFGLRRRLISLT